MKYNNDVKKDLEKNAPNLLPPAINLFISLTLIVIITIMKIKTPEMSLGLYISFLVILILFPAASFLNSYVSRKQKTKMLKNYEKETEDILAFMKYRAKFKIFDDFANYNASFSIIESDNQIKYIYNKEKSSLGYPSIDNAFITIGIGFTGLEVDPKTKEVTGLSGVLPKSIWLPKKLNVPTPTKKGYLKVTPLGLNINKSVYLSINKTDDTYYDSKKGVIVIGERKITPIDDVVQLGDGVIVVLRDTYIKSLWINVGTDLLK